MIKVGDTFIYYPKVNVDPGDSIEFCLTDTLGIIFYGPICSKYYYVDTGIEEHSPKPDLYGIGNNYPNPFNAATTIEYNVKIPNQRIKIEIYNLEGKLVKSLI
ncbi:hypothetical protein JW877_06940, partial [bacterium]|nr:hypothetical protein [bacterium]